CEDICDELVGVYPKTFKFVGWHPFCRCIVVPKLADEDEFIARQQALIDGEDVPDGGYSGEITDYPEGFTSWVKDNAERIENATSEPYFIRDNRAIVGNIMREGTQGTHIGGQEEAERERIRANRKEYERLLADPNYAAVEFNSDSGGLKATHAGHIIHSSKKEPTFFGDEKLTSTDLELECQHEIFLSGGKCILLEEGKTLEKGLILPALDADINGNIMDIRSITKSKDHYGAAIMAKVKQLKRYNTAFNTNISDLCLYFHEPTMYSDGCIERGFKWIEDKIDAEELENLRRVFVVIRGGKKIITIKMHGS
ncbi:MAG: hypothetical protein K2G35_04200, partial [Duncaniella sp.]|nr:hypothetical protein [Duncaniella sp.]